MVHRHTKQDTFNPFTTEVKSGSQLKLKILSRTTFDLSHCVIRVTSHEKGFEPTHDP